MCLRLFIRRIIVVAVGRKGEVKLIIVLVNRTHKIKVCLRTYCLLFQTRRGLSNLQLVKKTFGVELSRLSEVVVGTIFCTIHFLASVVKYYD